MRKGTPSASSGQAGDKGQGTRDKGQGTRDKGQGTRIRCRIEILSVVQKRTTDTIEKDGLDKLMERAGVIVFRARTVFPFTIFPNEITITLNRVVVVMRGLMFQDEYPMPFEAITGARVVRTFYTAALHIETFGVAKPPPIEFLSVNEARLARRYILALVECKKNNIDLAKYPIEELKEKLKEIGMVRESIDHDHNSI